MKTNSYKHFLKTKHSKQNNHSVKKDEIGPRTEQTQGYTVYKHRAIKETRNRCRESIKQWITIETKQTQEVQLKQNSNTDQTWQWQLLALQLFIVNKNISYQPNWERYTMLCNVMRVYDHKRHGNSCSIM